MMKVTATKVTRTMDARPIATVHIPIHKIAYIEEKRGCRKQFCYVHFIGNKDELVISQESASDLIEALDQ